MSALLFDHYLLRSVFSAIRDPSPICAPGRPVGCLTLLLIVIAVLVSDPVCFADTTKNINSMPRKVSLNADWRFLCDDAEGAKSPTFDDSQWTTVSCPHTWNDIDTFDDFGTGGHQGETDLWQGTAWYRKEFSLPADATNKQVVLEFEAVRQIADVYLNGHHLGTDKTGFIPFGFDLTPHLNKTGTNVLAVKANNAVEPELYSGTTPWHHQNWHPPHGGIYRNVYLHVLDPVHVTLPLYGKLGTEGVYAWTESLSKDRAVVGLTAEVENSQQMDTDATVTFSLRGHDGEIVACTEKMTKIAAGERTKVESSLNVTDPHLWEPDYPYVYTVEVAVSVDGTQRDTSTSPFGIRNFRFDRDTGFWINGHPLKLHGWGQKPIAGWAGLGAGIPNWMHDYTLKLMEEAGGNLIRWGHCAGPAVGVESSDKYGFVTIMPGVDGEKDCHGEAWQIRTAAFRDMIIYYRNHPAICVWEGGNYSVSPSHAAEMKAITQKWDPRGQRYFGFRMSTPEIVESIDLELGTVGRTRAFPSLPVVETEYDRTETPRRVWDKYSPPDFGSLGKLAELNTYNLTSEGFATNAIEEWWTLFGSKPDHSGGANWIFSDGTHGTRQRTDCARATGEVDAVRLPKEAYWALQATWDNDDRVHLIGHWNYPQGTVKPIYAVSKADRAELFVNGKCLGEGQRSFGTLFTWPDVVFDPGAIKVVAYRDEIEIARQVKQTAGKPVAIRLTPTTAPGGWRADGSDIALIDFEVVDAQGCRCPTDQARVDFDVSGPSVWRGGYNSGKEDSTNHFYLDTECGINRVSIRSKPQPGEVVITAHRKGLASATLRLQSKPVEIHRGIMNSLPPVFDTSLPQRPEIDAAKLAELTVLINAPRVTLAENAADDRLFSMFAYTGNGVGGTETPYQHEMLPYSDEARIYIKEVPEFLKDSRVIRTAKNDSAYWAADYIVATAGRDIDLFVAHDVKVPQPNWLKDFDKTGDQVHLNRGRLQIYRTRLAKNEELRIPGNADQGKGRTSHLNMILFCKPVAND
ncbi:beta-galactosidase [Rhodopirellula rubra]|uniref:Beta-galactosidase n=1 Tax=Aporhodopirellula rubra TaxID=980271 RepID=A0A7W5H8J6_9BACT|nr:sugar-binding domain-containing protein [Aporhodopirellula rubra]MBB3209499.1 beta-galactosidase [Aporhodopirellula rubra]